MQMNQQASLRKIQVQAQLAELEAMGCQDVEVLDDDDTMDAKNAANTQNGGK